MNQDKAQLWNFSNNLVAETTDNTAPIMNGFTHCPIKLDPIFLSVSLSCLGQCLKQLFIHLSTIKNRRREVGRTAEMYRSVLILLHSRLSVVPLRCCSQCAAPPLFSLHVQVQLLNSCPKRSEVSNLHTVERKDTTHYTDSIGWAHPFVIV